MGYSLLLSAGGRGDWGSSKARLGLGNAVLPDVAQGQVLLFWQPTPLRNLKGSTE